MSTGIDAQWGFAPESTYGTAVTPTAFLPLNSESFKTQIARMESAGIIAGRRVLASNQWAPGDKMSSGDIETDLHNRGLGKLFTAMFGAVTTTGSGPTFTHTFTPGNLKGKSLTVQFGRPGVGGTVHPFTYAGVKVTSWEISCTAKEIAKLKISGAAKSETTATALAVASYPASIKPMHFNHGAVSLGGSPVKVKSFTLVGDNALNVDRYFLGDDTMDEPLEEDLRTYSGTLDLEFVDLTQYNRYVSANEVALSIGFTQGTDSLTFAGNVRLDGEGPSVGDRSILTQSVGFKCVASGADSTALTATLVNGDATP